MAKAIIKTTENEASVADFINKIEDEQKRKDSFVLVDLMEKATGDKAKMWGGAIIGFGNLLSNGRIMMYGRQKIHPQLTIILTMRINFRPKRKITKLVLMTNC